jgi:hypothetical protein
MENIYLQERLKLAGIELSEQQLEDLAQLAKDLQSQGIYNTEAIVDALRVEIVNVVSRVRDLFAAIDWAEIERLQRKERHRKRYLRMTERGKKA